MKNIVLTIMFYTLTGITYAQSTDFGNDNELKDSPAQNSGTITDYRDGNTYRTIKIGNQWWFSQNLNYYVTSGIKYLNNDSVQNASKYGLLYEWKTAANSCPAGWHLPTHEEWRYLEMELGFKQNEPVKSNNFYGTNEGDKLKDTVLWDTPNTNNNSSGFSALPGGHYAMGQFWGENTVAQFWADEKNSNEAWYRSLGYNNSGIHIYYQSKTDGYKSVRCVKDTIELTGDYFGQEKPDTIPKPFGLSIISLYDNNEHTASFSPDGKSFYFTRDPDRKTFLMTKYHDDSWENPVRAEFDGREAIFSPDGSKLFFGDGDIWFMEKNGDIWDTPQKMGDEINTGNNEYYASTTSSGNIYFSRIENGIASIYVSKFMNGKNETAVKLPEQINTTGISTFHPFIAPDESYLLFNSNKSGGFGETDLYISYLSESKNWSNPINLGRNINSTDRDICPVITPDGKYLLFTRNWEESSNWYGNLYWVNTSFIEDLKSDATYPDVSDIFEINNNGICIFPNPTNQTIQIKTNGDFTDISNYQLLDINGKVIKEGKLDTDIIDISGISTGAYFFSYSIAKKTFAQKIVIN
ncbi:FISUMP domain-containing protein [Saccharicrinis sp. FJH2]|uniref:FISUMP domain-containing protein n=1 Tax=Saccharicrinis sp. FJH65 TaxID=3344659 RepID=UPI0035F2DB1F